MLQKLYEVTKGRETVDVDFVDLTKKAGYFPSIDSIVSQMKKEGWVTESRTNILRITHWGVAEAKKVAANGPDSKRQAEREARRLLSETREFIVLIEEYLADPSDEHLDGVSTKFSNISKALEALKKA
ncbi:MAG: hypothetical protein LC113_01485 [Acidobacteria bacterium]|nr:hypothetical protein [Acidobacteriota bacterium]